MLGEITVLDMAQSLARHSSVRHGLVTENIANADTPRYRAQDIKPFSAVYQAPDQSLPRTAFQPAATRPGHAGTDRAGSGYAGLANLEVLEISRIGASSSNGNSVSLEDQLVRGAEVKANHDMSLGIMRKSMDLIRATLGRN